MRRKNERKAIIAAVLVYCTSVFGAGPWWIDYHLEINDSDIYDGEMFIINPGSVDMYGGEVTQKLEFRGSTTGNIYGGELNWLWTDDNSVINIYGGSITWMASRPDSTVYLHAFDVNYYDDGGELNQPWLEGKYISNSNYFFFTFDGLDSVPQVEIIPEPSTLMLLSFGLSILLKRKK